MDESLSGWYGHMERLADERSLKENCCGTAEGKRRRDWPRKRCNDITV